MGLIGLTHTGLKAPPGPKDALPRPCSYSSNINLAVENSSWNDEKQLQDMSFAFDCDAPGAGMAENSLAQMNGIHQISYAMRHIKFA
ncbi:hypothetical protein Q3G72_028520 [Acer saccharum]|nr:hypothetical protein Q3G72_028520 [Acer saccharum]